MMTKKDYLIYEEVVISVLSDKHNPSKIALFVNNENLNVWISLRFSFELNGLWFFQSSKQEACQYEIFQMLCYVFILSTS